MKPKEQRLAIAEALGWKIQRGTDLGEYDVWIHPVSKLPTVGGLPPVFTEDLHAVAEAYASLCPGHKRQWASHLVSIVDRDSSNGEVSMLDVCDELEILGICANATAQQRCEAFLKTAGLWVE